MTKSIAQLTDATFHFHTAGNFSCIKTTVIATTVFAGLTALVIGILAIKAYITIPLENGAIYCVVGGSLAIQGAALALIILAVKNARIHKHYGNFLRQQADEEADWWITVTEKTLEAKTDHDSKRYTLFAKLPEEDLFTVLVCNKSNYAIHFFTNERDTQEMVTALHFYGFERRNWVKDMPKKEG